MLTQTETNLENRSTHAFTIDTLNIIDAAMRINIEDCLHVQHQSCVDGRLKTEFEIHKLEEQIIIGRRLLAINEGDTTEIEEYVSAANIVYTRHLNKMLELRHINARTNSPPVLPITFSVEETSELYWTLVQYGNIEPVVSQVEHGLKENMSRFLEKMSSAQPEEHGSISHMIESINMALEQWRPKAEAVVHGRCMAIQSMIAAEIMVLRREHGDLEVQDCERCIGDQEVYCLSDSSIEEITQE